MQQKNDIKRWLPKIDIAADFCTFVSAGLQKRCRQILMATGFVDNLYNTIQARVAKGYSFRGTPVYNLTRDDIREIERVAAELNYPPEWLANLINFESGGTFNPAIQNSIGATGLIQFLPSTARQMGTTTDALKRMSFKQQMEYVRRHIAGFAKKRTELGDKFSQTDLFMMIFYPVAVGKRGYQFPANVQRANNGIKTPMDYTKFALSTSTVPFKNIPEYVKDALQYASKNKGKVLGGLMVIAGLTTLAIMWVNGRG